MTEPTEPRERAVAFVVARLGSSRLASKQLRNIGDRLVLDWVVDRLRACTEVDEIVITTTASSENEPLREYASERGLACYSYAGDEEHVTNRLRCAAEEYEADINILVSADSPLIHSPGVDILIGELRAHPNTWIVGGRPPHGERPPSLLSGVHVARRACWQLADDLSDTPDLKRHQFPIISRREELFHVHSFSLPNWYYQHGPRLSVDTWADLEFMNAVHDRLIASGKEFNLSSVIELCNREPKWAELNSHVRQRQTEDHLQQVLFVVDAGGEYGHEKLLRSRELALQVVETQSWPVCFLVDELDAKHMIEQRGLSVRWGAVGRRAKPAPEGVKSLELEELSREFQLAVLDLAPDRVLPSGWRKRLDKQCRVAVLDDNGSWTQEAELRIGLPNQVVLQRGTKRILRDGARFGQALPTKTCDLLTNLRSPKQLAALRRFAERNQLSLSQADRHHPNFERELARSRVFITQHGYGTFDALALGTSPIVWSHKESEHELIEESCRSLDMPALYVRRESDLYVIHAALAHSVAPNENLSDGTLDLIEQLVKSVGSDVREHAA